jgi:plastocyanin
MHIALLCLFVFCAYSANHNVNVGQGGLTFSPDSLTIGKQDLEPLYSNHSDAGDSITFRFVEDTHNVLILDAGVDTTCSDPGLSDILACSWEPTSCSYANGNEILDDAGTSWVYTTGSSDAGKDFNFVCTPHCTDGMVGTYYVNPASVLAVGLASLLPLLVLILSQ